MTNTSPDPFEDVPITALCDTCGTGITWIDCPTGGWWAHDVHPADHHDAATAVEVAEDEDNSGRLYAVGVREEQS